MTIHPHGSYYATLDQAAVTRLREIYEHYNIPTIISARNLDFHWRKDGLTGVKEADAVKDLLRYLPAILAKLAANPDAPVAPEPAPHAGILAAAERQEIRQGQSSLKSVEPGDNGP